MSNALAFYVYCVAETAAVAKLSADSLPSAIEEGTDLEWVKAGVLSALSSRVPLESYSEERLAEHLSDANWTAVRAMRHQTVMEHVARRIAVVPVRFGTIYLKRAGVEGMLDENVIELIQILERLRGCEEWGVNVFCDQSILMASITSVSPVLRELSEKAAQASPGQSYLMQKKIDTLKVDESRNALGRIIEEIEKALSDESDDAKRLRVLKVEATEHGELRAKFAFLVKKAEFEKFRDAAERLAQEHQTAGVRLELTGPWPAYNFTVFDNA
jgi:hypothetical protein